MAHFAVAESGEAGENPNSGPESPVASEMSRPTAPPYFFAHVLKVAPNTEFLRGQADGQPMKIFQIIKELVDMTTNTGNND